MQLPEDLICPLCKLALEDEMHILFYCKTLDDLRQKFIPDKYSMCPSDNTFTMQNEDCVQDLGRYIYHSNKRRNNVQHLWFFFTQTEKKCESIYVSSVLSGRPAVWPFGRVQNLNVGFFSKAMIPNQIKLAVVMIAVKLFAATPSLVTIDLCLGHRVGICTE